MFKHIRALSCALVLALVAAAIPAAYAHSGQPGNAHTAQALQQDLADAAHLLRPSSDWQVKHWRHEHASPAAAFVLNLLAQPAEAASISNYWQNHLIDFLLRGQTLSAPATIYVALDTTTGSASACGTEVSGGSYARVAVTSSLANWAGTQGAGTTVASSGTSGQTSNNNAITFPAPTANWGSIVGFCFFDASTGGNELLYAPLTVSKTVNNGDAAPSFAAGSLTWTLTDLIQPHLARPAANDTSYRVAA